MINEHSAVKEINLLRPRNNDILIFHLHRKPVASDASVVNRTLGRISAQVLVFLLGPGDSVEQIVNQHDDEALAKYGLQRIKKGNP